MDSEAVSNSIIGAAIRVHSELGPGLLESAYRASVAHELRLRNLEVETEVRLPIVYRGVKIDAGYRLDLLVEKNVIVELKAVDRLLRVHEAQLLSYLKLSNVNVGLLINFCVPQLRLGIRRLVCNYEDPPRPNHGART
jgi:GxxExxY protein